MASLAAVLRCVGVGVCVLLLAACGGGGGATPGATTSSSSLTAAGSASLGSVAQALARSSCEGLALFRYPSTTITSATLVAPGPLGGAPVGEHCRVSGAMNERKGVNGDYAIGFELRLPLAWNGRFFFQANGGFDGVVWPAVGIPLGGGALANALGMGFAVISSDAGHQEAQNQPGAQHFGLDPQARLDYGHQFIATLTPMARELVRAAYGRAPDRMYIGGCSNGGRQALVAAARYPHLFDGYLVGAPGFNLPKSVVQMLWDTQQLAGAATATRPDGLPDIASAFTPAERRMVAQRIVARCDALDGARDGMVLDVKGCQAVFDPHADLPACAGARDGQCLTQAQKRALAGIYGGARNSAAVQLHAGFPLDRGIAYEEWVGWKFTLNPGAGASAMPYLMTSPPVPVAESELLSYSLKFSMDQDAPRIFAGGGAFEHSAMAYLTPPAATELAGVKARHGKILIAHGTSDPVFSSNDTAAWYEALRDTHGGDASDFARYFPVPGMGHCAGGAATDQFDGIAALVAWVEQERPPEVVLAHARGKGNAGGANADVPADWSPTRTRPLCMHPKVARLKADATDLESAASFACQ